MNVGVKQESNPGVQSISELGQERYQVYRTDEDFLPVLSLASVN